MKAAISLLLLMVMTQAYGAEPINARPPIVRIVRPVDSNPALGAAVPPAPPTVKQALAFQEDGSDLYSCGNGSAVNYASAYRAFVSRYQESSVDEKDGYVAAQPSLVPDPVFPAGMRKIGYVLAMVAVSKDGSVRDSLLVCSTDSLFNEYIAEAVRAATFKPATSHGLAVASLETIEYWMPRF